MVKVDIGSFQRSLKVPLIMLSVFGLSFFHLYSMIPLDSNVFMASLVEIYFTASWTTWILILSFGTNLFTVMSNFMQHIRGQNFYYMLFNWWKQLQKISYYIVLLNAGDDIICVLCSCAESLIRQVGESLK